jgi:hypothetical protein
LLLWVKFVIRDYWNGTKKDNAFYFEFLPKGIATSNNQTAELLREGILGYQDVSITNIMKILNLY